MNAGSILSLDGTSTSVSLSSNGVSFAGATALTFDSAPVAGTYDVIKYGAGGVSGLGNLSSATIRAILTDDTLNQKVTAAVSTGARTWDTTDGTWEYGGANTDWQEGDQQFFAGDSVVFGNPAAASAITLTGLLTPASVSVDNTNSYTFAGSGSIVGATSLTKSGVGALAINNANTFNGGTTITAGILTVGGVGALGTGSVALNGGTLDVNGNTISNAISLGGGEVSGSGTLSGAISGAAGVLTKSGAGTLVLATANNYGGGTSITNGGLTLTGAGSLGSGAVSIASGTTLNFSGNSYTLANTVTGAGSINNGVSNTVTGDFSGFTGTFTHNSATVSSSFNNAVATSKDAAYVIATVQGSSQGMIAGGSGNYTLELGSLSGVANSLFRGGNVATGTTTLQVGNLDANTDFAGSIANGATKILAFNKVGSGIQTLSGASTYTGVTTVSSGTLLVNGSLGNTAVTVESGATLGGSGGVVGLTSASITVAAGGTLGPGASAGTLSVNGNVTIDGVFAYEYDGATSSADLLDVNGTLMLNSATLTLSDLFGNSYNMGDKFTLAAYDTLIGTFSGYADDTAYVFGGGEWLINYNDDTAGLNGGAGSNFITMTAIPEPSASLIGGLGMLALLRRRRG
jgi:autotransporter-associated beta strand protein